MNLHNLPNSELADWLEFCRFYWPATHHWEWQTNLRLPNMLQFRNNVNHHWQSMTLASAQRDYSVEFDNWITLGRPAQRYLDTGGSLI